MGELAEFLQAVAAFGDEALPPAAPPGCAAPDAACPAPSRMPSSAAAAAPPSLPPAKPWGVQAAQAAACAPGGESCGAAGAAPSSAPDDNSLSLRAWEPFGAAERSVGTGANAAPWAEGGAAAAPPAEAGGAAVAQTASDSATRSVREQMAELELGLLAMLACAQAPSAPPAHAAPAEPARTAAEPVSGRPACDAEAANLPASPPGGPARGAAPCEALPAARLPPCQAPGLGMPLVRAGIAPTHPNAPQPAVHPAPFPLQAHAMRGPPLRGLPGAAALRQSLQAEDAATPLAAGLRFGVWVDALGPASAKQAEGGGCQQVEFHTCRGRPAWPDAGTAELAGSGNSWGWAPGAWAGCAVQHAERGGSSCARGSEAALAAWPEAGNADGSGQKEIRAYGFEGCGGFEGPAWQASPADAVAATAPTYGSRGAPRQPLPADAGAAAASASSNPFAGRPASCAAGPARASPETLARGNPFWSATAPTAVRSSASS